MLGGGMMVIEMISNSHPPLPYRLNGLRGGLKLEQQAQRSHMRVKYRRNQQIKLVRQNSSSHLRFLNLTVKT